MVGNCTAPQPDPLPTIPWKSAFRSGFNKTFALFIFVLACAGPGRYDRPEISEKSLQPILNIRFLDEAGPLLGNKIVLMEPSDITINKLGEIYISDSELNAVIKFSDNLELLSFEGGIGGEAGYFNRPSGVGCDAAMNLYVADSGNRRIQILDRNLRPANDIDEYFQKDGSAEGFKLPEDVAIDLEGNIWVADDDRVLKINTFNELELELSYTSLERLDIGKAVSVAVSPAGNIAIGDSGNRKIFVITSYGNLLSEFNVVSVSSVAWEDNNIIWISSVAKKTVSAYDISGNRLFAYSDREVVSRPVSLFVTGEGILMVADDGRRTIYRLEIIRNKVDQSEK